MVKQIIGVGASANDGTGDILRTAFQKTNSNFTELYDGLGDIVVPTSLTGLGITDGTNGQVLTTNGGANFTFQTLGLLSLGITDGTANQVLSTDGNGTFTFVNQTGGGGSTYTDSDAIAAVVGADLDMGGNKVLFGNVYDAVNDLPNASSYHGMFAHVHGTGAAYYAHAGAWVQLANAEDLGGGGSSLQTRTTKAATASSLANEATTNLTISGFKGYALYSIETSHAAWVRLYIDTTARASDSSRTINTDPAPDAGVIAEVITTGGQKVDFGPAVIGYCSTGTDIYATVTNKSGGTENVAVTLTVLQLES
jgi:hypothetical protein